MKKLWLSVVLLILLSSSCFGHIWRDGLQNASTDRGYYGLSLCPGGDGDGFIDVNTADDDATFTTSGLSVQVYPGDVFTARFKVIRLPSDYGYVVGDVSVGLNVGGTWYDAPVSDNPISDTAVHTITHTFTQAGTLSQIDFDPKWGSNKTVIRILDYSITRSWNDDMQNATTNRTYSGLTMVADGDGYIDMRPTIDQPTFATSNLSMHFNAGDVFTAEYSVPTLPSDGCVDDIFVQLYIDGAWVRIPSTGAVRDTGTHYIRYMFKQAGTLTSINFNPQWGYVSGGTSAVIRLSDYTIKPLWHDDMENLSRNYSGLHLVRSGEGYLEVGVDQTSPSLCTSLSERVFPGDIITSTWQASQLPTDDGVIDDLITQFNIGGSWYNVRRGSGTVSDTKVHTVAYEVTQIGILTDIQTSPTYGYVSSNGDSAGIKVFNYSVRRPNWNDDLEDSVQGRNYYSMTKDSDGLGYIDVLVSANDTTFDTTNLSVSVSPGDVFTVKYQVTQLPWDDSRVQGIFARLCIGGTWYSTSISDIGDTAEHTITYTIPVAGTLTEVYFNPQYGYSSSGNSAIVRIFDYTIMPQYLYMLKTAVEPNFAARPSCFTVLADNHEPIIPDGGVYPGMTQTSTSWTPSADDTARGYVVNRIDIHIGTTTRDPNWIWPGATITADANVVAAPGEFRCISYAVRGLKYSPNLDVRATDLTSSVGGVIRSENIEIRNLNNHIIARDAGHGILDWETKFLDKSIPTSIEQNWTSIIFVEVYVPTGTPAGTYSGYMTFFDDQGNCKTGKLWVDVLGFTVADPVGAWGMVIPGHTKDPIGVGEGGGIYINWADDNYYSDNLVNYFTFWKARCLNSPTLYSVYPGLNCDANKNAVATFGRVQTIVDAMNTVYSVGNWGPLNLDLRNIAWWARVNVNPWDPCIAMSNFNTPGNCGEWSIPTDEVTTFTADSNITRLYGQAVDQLITTATTVANHWPSGLHLLPEEEVGFVMNSPGVRNTEGWPKAVTFDAFINELKDHGGANRAYLVDSSIGWNWTEPNGIDRGEWYGLTVRQYNSWDQAGINNALADGQVWNYNVGFSRMAAGLYNLKTGSTGYTHWSDHYVGVQLYNGVSSRITWDYDYINTLSGKMPGCMELKLDADDTTFETTQNLETPSIGLSVPVLTNDVLTVTFKLCDAASMNVRVRYYYVGGSYVSSDTSYSGTSIQSISSPSIPANRTITGVGIDFRGGSGRKVRVYDISLKRGTATLWQDDMRIISPHARNGWHVVTDQGIIPSMQTEQLYEGLRDLGYYRKLQGLVTQLNAAHFTSQAAAANTVLGSIVSDVPLGHTDLVNWSRTLGTYECDSRRNRVATQIGIAIATLAHASTPGPVDGAVNVVLNPTLTWAAGTGTPTHDVYFGTSLADVTNATRTVTLGVLRSQGQAGTSYVPSAPLLAKQTYYWRIDEVVGSVITKGFIWSFTTIANVPTFVAAGSVASGTGTITPSLPAGITSGDILLLFLETANQAISITNQNGGTWTAVTNSPQGTGTAGSTTSTRLTAFWSRYNGTQGVPTASDSGDHQFGRIIAIRGAVSSGNPWDVTSGGVEATSDTSGSISGATTTAVNTLVVAVVAASLPDAIGTANFSSWANGSLTSITERTDNTQDVGNGGGLGVVTGIKAIAGVYGNTTVTHGSSAIKGMMSIAIKP